MTDAMWAAPNASPAPAASDPPRRWEMPVTAHPTEPRRSSGEAAASPLRSSGEAAGLRTGPAGLPVAAGPPAARAALHTAAGERLAARNEWEAAYRHLREAVRLLHGDRPGEPHDELDRLRREHAEAHEQSRRDSLTASYNRRYLDERLAVLTAPGGASGLCLALADIDHFKQVNDSHGHPFGDRVLQRMVVELGRGLPDGAFCARYGGEEFALVLPDRDLAEGVRVAEAARERIAGHDWSSMHPDLRLTISVGVARAPATVAEVDALVADADLLLYTAKQAGRNAVAFRRSGRVELAGAAAGRRAIPQAPVPGTAGPPTGP